MKAQCDTPAGEMRLEASDEWVEMYNGRRPHQAMEWMTPDEKRAENLGRSSTLRHDIITRRGHLLT